MRRWGRETMTQEKEEKGDGILYLGRSLNIAFPL